MIGTPYLKGKGRDIGDKMDEEYRSLKNPFAGFNASLMDDSEIIQYWSRPEILFERQAIGVDLTGKIPVVLMGGRGTGKTMLLKFLSNEVQIKKYVLENKKRKEFLSNQQYIGVYYRFDGPNLSSFDERYKDDIVWDTIFKHFFELVIGQKYIIMVLNLKKENYLNIKLDLEKKIAEKILKLLRKEKYEIENENNPLECLTEIIQDMVNEVFKFINDSALKRNIEFNSQIIPPGDCIFEIPKILINFLPDLNGKNIIILLDEYENLLEYQQKIVNTLIKHTREPVTFRIGMRIYGFKTQDTLNDGEFLMEDADYRKILFEDILLSNKREYKNLLKAIAKKRLEAVSEFQQAGLMGIEEILGDFKPVDEALNIVYGKRKITKKNTENKENKIIKNIRKELERREFSNKDIKKFLSTIKYPQNPLIEMLNLLLIRRDYKIENMLNLFNAYVNKKRKSSEFKEYLQLYEKNKLGLLFQLISLYRPKKKIYASFQIFSMLSSGIARNFLELCYQSFNLSLFSGDDLFEKKMISLTHQTEGAEIRAEKFFEMIERIPKYGNEIKSLVRSIGAIFNAWQMDERLREPEVTYFCIDNTSLSRKSRKILETAVQWSVLQQKKSMKGKLPTEPLLDVYAINRILAPYFGISYRLRGRIPQFKKEEIEILIFGNDEEKKAMIKKLGRQNKEEMEQLNLYDFIR